MNENPTLSASGTRIEVPIPFGVDNTDDRQMHEVLAQAGIRALLALVGDDPDREGLLDTPARVVKAYRELCGAPGDPETLLSKVFQIEDADSVVAVGPIEFVSVCEHHLLPFTGTAWIAYIPAADKVVGLSKLPRLLQHYAARPQVQERLGAQVTAAMDKYLDAKGSACVIKSSHSCMALRGVKVSGAQMVTSSLTGAFRDDPRTRAEFLALTHG